MKEFNKIQINLKVKEFDKIQINLNKKRWTVWEVLEILKRCGVKFEGSNMLDIKTYRINYKEEIARRESKMGNLRKELFSDVLNAICHMGAYIDLKRKKLGIKRSRELLDFLKEIELTFKNYAKE